MKSLRVGNMVETYNIHIQILTTRFREHSLTMMTSIRIWPWVTARIAWFWAAVLRKIPKRWTSKVCFPRALRIKSLMVQKLSQIIHHTGKYNNPNIKIRANLFIKCLHHFIRSSQAQSVSSQRCWMPRLWWWIKWSNQLICQTLLPKPNPSLWLRELSSQKIAPCPS